MSRVTLLRLLLCRRASAAARLLRDEGDYGDAVLVRVTVRVGVRVRVRVRVRFTVRVSVRVRVRFT